MKINKTYEWCPHCENEVRINNNNISNCPNCKAYIKPCSTCELMECDLIGKTGCLRFPKGDPVN